VAWKNGLTAVVLDNGLPPAARPGLLTAIQKNGGVVAIEADGVLLGWFPRGIRKLTDIAGVRSISRSPIDPASAADDDSNAAIGFFNRVVTGEYEDRVEAGLDVVGKPLVGCTANARPRFGSETSTRSPHLPFETGPDFWQNQPWQNPTMRGRVRVNYFKLESNGAIDPNLYTWSYGDSIIADDQIFGAFTFWANEAASRGITLSFSIKRYSWGGLQRWQNWAEIPYEPITRPRTDDYLWMNAALSHMGYPASPVTDFNVYTQNDNFNNASKAGATPAFDRAFTVYLVYNPGSAPTTFADGYRGYAFVDGPHATVMWNTAGWGPNNLGRVLTHETGHIFFACDEYFDAATGTGCLSCNPCITYGPRPNVQNGNCDSTTGACLIPRVTCVMKTIDYALCPHTPVQIGW